MKIAVIGAGNVGGTLGRGWAVKGHDVTFGVPDPGSGKVRDLLASIPSNAAAGTVGDAAHGAEVVVLATPWGEPARDAVAACGDLAGRTVLAVTNPLKPDFSDLEDGYSVSGAERVAEWARGASVFKAFNQTGWNIMADPMLGGRRAVMFACGDDAERKPVVLRLVEEIGFEAVDAGGLRVARLLEPYAMLWIHLAHGQGVGRDFAFSLVRRS